jgi:hypothetical protein
VTSYKIATVERRNGAPVRKGRRGAFAEVPQVTRAVSALRSLTYVRGRKKGRRWPRAWSEGADESRLYGW